jgi:hypothetical protein
VPKKDWFTASFHCIESRCAKLENAHVSAQLPAAKKRSGGSAPGRCSAQNKSRYCVGTESLSSVHGASSLAIARDALIPPVLLHPRTHRHRRDADLLPHRARTPVAVESSRRADRHTARAALPLTGAGRIGIGCARFGRGAVRLARRAALRERLGEECSPHARRSAPGSHERPPDSPTITPDTHPAAGGLHPLASPSSLSVFGEDRFSRFTAFTSTNPRTWGFKMATSRLGGQGHAQRILATLAALGRRQQPVAPARDRRPPSERAAYGAASDALASASRPPATLEWPRASSRGSSSPPPIPAAARAWRRTHLVAWHGGTATAPGAWRGLSSRMRSLEPSHARRRLSASSQDGVAALSSVTTTAKVFNDGLDPMVRGRPPLLCSLRLSVAVEGGDSQAHLPACLLRPVRIISDIISDTLAV